MAKALRTHSASRAIIAPIFSSFGGWHLFNPSVARLTDWIVGKWDVDLISARCDDDLDSGGSRRQAMLWKTREEARRTGSRRIRGRVADERNRRQHCDGVRAGHGPIPGAKCRELVRAIGESPRTGRMALLERQVGLWIEEDRGVCERLPVERQAATHRVRRRQPRAAPNEQCHPANECRPPHAVGPEGRWIPIVKGRYRQADLRRRPRKVT